MFTLRIVIGTVIYFVPAVAAAGSGQSGENELSFNGTFFKYSPESASKASSEESRYWCQYDAGQVGDEIREVKRTPRATQVNSPPRFLTAITAYSWRPGTNMEILPWTVWMSGFK